VQLTAQLAAEGIVLSALLAEKSRTLRVGRGTTLPRVPLFPRAGLSKQMPTEDSYGLSILVVRCVVVRKAFNFDVH
jgi:hypothetical protein